MNKNRFAFSMACAVVALAMGGQSVADDLFPPPWRGQPLTTLTEWEFRSPANPVPPDGDIIPVVGDGLGPTGFPEATISGPLTWDPWDGNGAWIGTGPDPLALGFIDLQIPNWIDTEPIKFLQIQITTQPRITQPSPGVILVENPFVAGIAASDPAGIIDVTRLNVSELDLMTIDGHWHRTELWRIRPNPDWEIIRIAVPIDSLVDQIVVDTISTVPEPASLALTALASLAFAGFVRRR
jgi:hypothetical protein